MSKKKKKPATQREPEPQTDPESQPGSEPHAPEFPPLAPLSRSHLRFGWWSLLAFLLLGVTLEALHGFKIGWYLESANATRRLMFTLAHAHGVLLALVHIGFAFTVGVIPNWSGRGRSLASANLNAASLLIPGGFLLGGMWIYDGDPGLGILLVPLGALCLFTAVFLTARNITRA